MGSGISFIIGKINGRVHEIGTKVVVERFGRAVKK